MGLRGLNAYASNYEHIGQRFRLLHGDLFNSLDITHPVMKGIDDLNVLDVRNSVPAIVETFHIVPEALIILLLDGL
jgi:hypothetical protein